MMIESVRDEWIFDFKIIPTMEMSKPGRNSSLMLMSLVKVGEHSRLIVLNLFVDIVWDFIAVAWDSIIVIVDHKLDWWNQFWFICR